MADISPEHAQRVAKLQALQEQYERMPASLVAAFRVGVGLEDLGMRQEAFDVYDEIVKGLAALDTIPEVDHKVFEVAVIRGAEMTRLLHQDVDSKNYVAAALEHMPQSAMLLAELGRKAISGHFVDEARSAYERLAAIDPNSSELSYGRATLCEIQGRFDEADMEWRKQPFSTFFRRTSYKGEGRPVRVLHIGSVLYGNIAVKHFMTPQHFDVVSVSAETMRPGVELPEHDVVLNGIGDADRCRRGLVAAEQLVALSTKPIINAPAAVLQTGRVENSERLAALPGVVSAKMHTVPRAELLDADGPARVIARGFVFPLLMRGIGTHQGEDFHQVLQESDLAFAAEQIPGEEVTLIAFIDTSRADGTFRKYRVMCIDGELYPLHLAISHHWKIHYFSAEMGESEVYRDEERRFLADMHAVLGDAAVARLKSVFKMLDLEYAGADFTVDQDGRLVVFEANATMSMLAPAAGSQWDYRRPSIARAVAAAERMLMNRAA